MSSFFSAEELLGGLPARRASTLLYALEGRTAQLTLQSQQALASYLPERSAETQEREFLSALAQGRELPLQPTIQNIERYAAQWASLIPDDASLKAAIARLLGQKYQFRADDVPKMKASLGLAETAVTEAFQRFYDEPILSIYTPTLPLSERRRWLQSRLADRLENLPPFWTAFSLTLTETVGASILALPIALAGVGPLPGLAILVILGLINLLTIAGFVEAITRNGNMRYGNTYFGRLVEDYLGRPGRLLLTPMLVMLNVLTLMALYIGVSTTLATSTGVPAIVWAVLIFLVGLYFLKRETLNTTVASAMIIGLISIAIIFSLSFLALSHLEPENLSYVKFPFVNGEPFTPTVLGLIFGVILSSYFGHTSAGTAAKVVLRRDPGGRALLKGNIAAMSVVIIIYCLWVLAINAAIEPEILANVGSTALSPLTEEVGGIVPVLGIIYVILAMGMGSLHNSFSLFFQTREVLPEDMRRTTRFLVSVLPVVIIFLLVEWLLLTDNESFAGLLSISGVLAVPLLAGVFPLLMLAASRRKSDYVPERVFKFLGNRLLMAVVILLYWGAVLAHGLIIWERPIERAAAILVSIIIAAFTLFMFRRGIFTSRTTIELKVTASDFDKSATFALIQEGKLTETAVHLHYHDRQESLQADGRQHKAVTGLKRVTFELPNEPASELKVWLHQLTPEMVSGPLPATVILRGETKEVPIPLDSKGGRAILPLSRPEKSVEIILN